jgi:hypothetical protein
MVLELDFLVFIACVFYFGVDNLINFSWPVYHLIGLLGIGGLDIIVQKGYVIEMLLDIQSHQSCGGIVNKLFLILVHIFIDLPVYLNSPIHIFAQGFFIALGSASSQKITTSITFILKLNLDLTLALLVLAKLC